MKALCFIVFALGCASTPAASPGVAPEDASSPDVQTGDAGSDAADASKAAACASTFGDALTNAYGRLDGEVVAVVGPEHTQCTLPNDDHVVVQLSMNGAVYRVVVNVASTRGTDLRVRHASFTHPLPMPAWSPGWHTAVTLDYATTLDAHTSGTGAATFTPYEMPELVKRVSDAIPLGAKVSAYSWSSGGASSHLVHRNEKTPGGDGALVIDATGASPTWLLFHFASQTF